MLRHDPGSAAGAFWVATRPSDVTTTTFAVADFSVVSQSENNPGWRPGSRPHFRAMLSGKQEQYDGQSMGIFRGVG